MLVLSTSLTGDPNVWFEITYLIAAPVTLWMLMQFAFLAWLKPRVPILFKPLAVIFIVQDVIYNAVFGSLFFIERPREWLFTDRLKRWHGDWRVERFARVLNALDPGHV